jgi:uncharacterized membrane protein
MSEERPELPEVDRIEAVFRNGSVTVVGVIVGFSLTFLTAWASNPLPWSLYDLYGIVPLIAGVCAQLFSLAALLRPDSLEMQRYERAIRVFLIGLGLVAIGVAIAICVDAIGAINRAA